MRSAIRPPASTVTHAIASSAVSQAPGESTDCSSCTSRPSPLWIACHGIKPGELGDGLLPYALANAGAVAGSLSFRFRK